MFILGSFGGRVWIGVLASRRIGEKIAESGASPSSVENRGDLAVIKLFGRQAWKLDAVLRCFGGGARLASKHIPLPDVSTAADNAHNTMLLSCRELYLFDEAMQRALAVSIGCRVAVGDRLEVMIRQFGSSHFFFAETRETPWCSLG